MIYVVLAWCVMQCTGRSDFKVFSVSFFFFFFFSYLLQLFGSKNPSLLSSDASMLTLDLRGLSFGEVPPLVPSSTNSFTPITPRPLTLSEGLRPKFKMSEEFELARWSLLMALTSRDLEESVRLIRYLPTVATKDMEQCMSVDFSSFLLCSFHYLRRSKSVTPEQLCKGKGEECFQFHWLVYRRASTAETWIKPEVQGGMRFFILDVPGQPLFFIMVAFDALAAAAAVVLLVLAIRFGFWTEKKALIVLLCVMFLGASVGASYWSLVSVGYTSDPSAQSGAPKTAVDVLERVMQVTLLAMFALFAWMLIGAVIETFFPDNRRLPTVSLVLFAAVTVVATAYSVTMAVLSSMPTEFFLVDASGPVLAGVSFVFGAVVAGMWVVAWRLIGKKETARGARRGDEAQRGGAVCGIGSAGGSVLVAAGGFHSVFGGGLREVLLGTIRIADDGTRVDDSGSAELHRSGSGWSGERRTEEESEAARSKRNWQRRKQHSVVGRRRRGAGKIQGFLTRNKLKTTQL